MSQPPIELLAKDLNAQGGVYCPSPLADMKIWNSHPKVYLDVAHSGQAKCPYCGTVYKLKDGEHFSAPLNHCSSHPNGSGTR
ncbi:MAG: zinc-finger domain-containing protein [Betaproteobacteria bacterium]|nr:zinc-finger domain-containing protein [Betaproteobacteria bacterium]